MPRVVGRWCTTAAIDVSALMSALAPIIGAGIYEHRRALETSEVGNLNATVHWAHQLQAFFNCLHTELSTATPHKLTDLHSCGKAMLAELLHNPVRARLPTEHRRACHQLAHIVRQIAALLIRSQAHSLAHQGPRAHYVLCSGANLGFAPRRRRHVHPPPLLFLPSQTLGGPGGQTSCGCEEGQTSGGPGSDTTCGWETKATARGTDTCEADATANVTAQGTTVEARGGETTRRKQRNRPERTAVRDAEAY